MNSKNESPSMILLKIFLWPFKSFLRIFIVVFIVGLYIYQAVIIDQMAKEIRSLELISKKLENEKTTVEVQIEQLTNFDRIEKLAKEKFELINAGNQVEYMVIKKYEKKPIVDESIQLAGVQ